MYFISHTFLVSSTLLGISDTHYEVNQYDLKREERRINMAGK